MSMMSLPQLYIMTARFREMTNILNKILFMTKHPVNIDDDYNLLD